MNIATLCRLVVLLPVLFLFSLPLCFFAPDCRVPVLPSQQHTPLALSCTAPLRIPLPGILGFLYPRGGVQIRAVAVALSPSPHAHPILSQS
jgi:hypothetical protein